MSLYDRRLVRPVRPAIAFMIVITHLYNKLFGTFRAWRRPARTMRTGRGIEEGEGERVWERGDRKKEKCKGKQAEGEHWPTKKGGARRKRKGKVVKEKGEIE